MAGQSSFEEQIVSVVGTNPEQELDRLLAKMDLVTKSIVNINTQLKSMGGGSTLQSVVNGQTQLSDAAKQAAEALKEQAALKKKIAAEEKELNRLIAEEQKALRLKSASDERELNRLIAAEAKVIREKDLADKKRVAEEERALARLIAAEEKQRIASTRAERRAADKERLDSERAYQNTWKQLLNERDLAQRKFNADQKAAAARAVSAVAKDSIVALSATLDQHRLSYNRLTQAERENANIGGVLQGRIQELDRQIKSSDAALGVYRRNVGNYSSAFSGLGQSIRTIAGELPNIGISLRTFGQSLSNNIQPLIFGLQQAREQNRLWAEEGKATIPIGKQIAKSLFSWETAILAVVAGGIYLISNMKKVESATDIAAKANKKYAESLNSIEEGTRSTAQSEIAHANVLVKIASDATQSMVNRLKAVKELQDSYPARFGNLDKEAILEGKVADALRLTTQELLNKAAAQAAEKKFAAAGEQVYDLELALKAAGKEVDKFQARLDNDGKNGVRMTGGFKAETIRSLKAAREEYKGIAADLTKANSEQQNFLDDAKKFAQRAGDTILGQSEKTPKVKDTSAKDARDLERALEEETKLTLTKLKGRFEEEAAIQKDAYTDEKKTLKERLNAFDKFMLDEISIVKLAGTIQGDTTEEIQAKVTELVLKYSREREQIIKDSSDNQTKFEKDNLKGLIDFAGNTMASKKKGGKNAGILGFTDDDLKILENVNHYVDAALASQQALDAFANAASERRIQGYEKEIEAIRERADADILAYQMSTDYAVATEAERTAAIATIQAKAAEEEKQRLQDVANEKRKAAEREKAINIAEIIIKTALAVVNQLGGGDPYTAIPRAIAAGALGAAELAVAIATPIPQFAEGADDTGKAGLAWVGDGGKQEVIRTADGKVFITPATDTLVNMPAHSVVYPSIEDYIEKAQYLTMKGMGVMRRVDERTTDELLAVRFDKSINKAIGKVVNAIYGSEPIIIQSDFNSYYNRKVKR